MVHFVKATGLRMGPLRISRASITTRGKQQPGLGRQYLWRAGELEKATEESGSLGCQGAASGCREAAEYGRGMVTTTIMGPGWHGHHHHYGLGKSYGMSVDIFTGTAV